MYEAIGRAVWAAQVFETIIVVCVELVRLTKEFEAGALTDGLINPKRFKDATMNLLKKLSASNDIDPTFEAKIAALVDKRHTLIHRWFIEKGWPEDEDVNEIAQVISFAREVEEESQAITRLLLQYVLHWGTPQGETPHEPTQARAQILQLFKNAHMFSGGSTT